MRYVAVITCAAIAFLCSYQIDKSLFPDASAPDTFQLGGITSAAAATWAWLVFPKMGAKPLLDLILIATAFPVVGAVAGTLLFPGFGTVAGAVFAVIFPYHNPWPIGTLYLVGAVAAFILPRLTFGRP